MRCLDEMSIDDMSSDEMSVHNMAVDDMSVDDMSVDDMSADDMSVNSYQGQRLQHFCFQGRKKKFYSIGTWSDLKKIVLQKGKLKGLTLANISTLV